MLPRCRNLLLVIALVMWSRVPAATAASADGMLVVSVTIVATCDVSAVGTSAATVSCPQDFPYHVSVTPAGESKGLAVPATDARAFTGSHELALASLAPANRTLERLVSATDAQAVTRLTISY